jgi:hypothetical protein
MNVYARKGQKKLFSLTCTKLRLACESGTTKAIPAPVPLVKLFSGKVLRTTVECKIHWQRLKDEVDYEDDLITAHTTLQLCDIIESVKYGFETAVDMPQITDKELADIEVGCKLKSLPLRILLMTTETAPDSIYFGEDPPPGARQYSRVVSGIAPFLRYAFKSPHLHDGLNLKNVEVAYGGRSLIADAVNDALSTLIT